MGKPIKRSEHIIQLSKEHHFSLLFCWKVRSGLKKEVEIGRVVDYINYFWKEHLLPHFKEEDVLFSTVHDTLVKRAYDEHHEINATVHRLNSSTLREAPSLALKIADLVDNHVRFEERELFPHLERAIDEPRLIEIGKEIQQLQPEVAQDTFADEFWK
jgi:hemerythrin-like domain-containing protein